MPTDPEPAPEPVPISFASYTPIKPPELAENEPAPVVPALVSPVPPRAIRLIELVLLLAVAFGGAVYASLYAIFGQGYQGSGSGSQWVYSTIHELTALGLCGYLLHKQGRSFRQIGLSWKWSDPLAVPVILLLSFVITMLVSYGLYFSGHYAVAARAGQAAATAHLRLSAGLLAFNVVNGFFEELIVRAYLMTDVTYLTGSATWAVLVSASFQGVYHLYQGWQSALSATAAFLLFSAYYAWTRRITPLVVAHILWDLGILTLYSHPQAHR